MNQLTNLFRALTKAERADLITKLRSDILEGNVDPLQVELILKLAEETIKALRSDAAIREQVLNEVAKHGKTANIYGAEFTVSERKTWDYSNDRIWTESQATLECVKADMKDREKFLQAVPEHGTVDPDTGEIITRPPYTATQVLTIKIK